MSQRIFISYRRDDTSGYAHALAERLQEVFGASTIFMDVDALEPGVDFIEVIDASLSSCRVLITLIGNGWTGRQENRSRILEDNDYVRLEVANALARNIRVIPVLIDNVSMPDEDELPVDLQPLRRRQAIEWSSTRFKSDLDRIVEATKRAFDGQKNVPASNEKQVTKPKPQQPTPKSEPKTKKQPPLPPDPKRKKSAFRFMVPLLWIVVLLSASMYLYQILASNASRVGSSTTDKPTDRTVPTVSIDPGVPTYEPRPVASSPGTNASLYNFRVVKEGRGEMVHDSWPEPRFTSEDYIQFEVDFSYSGPASRVIVYGEAAINGRTVQFGFRPNGKNVVSGQASGTMLVTIIGPDARASFASATTNQIRVVLSHNHPNAASSEDILEAYFPFNKTWYR